MSNKTRLRIAKWHNWRTDQLNRRIRRHLDRATRQIKHVADDLDSKENA